MSGRSKPNWDVEASAEREIDGGELPEGWATAALGDLVAFMLGGDWGAESTVASLDYVKVRVVRGTDFRHWQESRAATAAERAVSKSSLEKRSLKRGDIVVEVSGGGPSQPVGRSVLIDTAALESSDQPLVCSNFFRLVRLHGEVESAFVNHFLNFSVRRGAFDEFQTQTTNLRNLNFNDYLAKTFVPLPPLLEQRRIVGKLELLLGKVSSSQRRLSRVPRLLKRFRQSVLAAACSGKLTADWREENDESRFGSPTEIDIPTDFPTLPESWSWTNLESVCVNVVDCPHSTPKWTDCGKLCIRTTNFRPGVLNLSEVRYVSSETFNQRIERLRPAPGDIVYSREGGILGIACQIPPGVELCLGQRMMLFRVGSKYTATLLMHWLNSPVITHRVQELTGGSASPHLNVRDIKAFPTPAPPLSEQQEIVRRVEKLFAFADQIEARLRQAQAHVDRLTQSLLAKAFRGELVPTEHTLAAAEGRDYEPASELLKRIHKSHGIEPVTLKPRKPKAARN